MLPRSLRTWLGLGATTPHRRAARRPRRFPSLEELENRLTPTGVLVHGAVTPQVRYGGGAGSMVALGDKALFLGRGATAEGLWVSDGTEIGTELVTPLPDGDYGGLTRVGDRAVFFAGGDDDQVDLWTTDGTAAKRITAFDDVRDVVPFAGKVYFLGTTAATGQEIWQTDGISAQLVKDLAPGPAKGADDLTATADGFLYFTGPAADRDSKQAVWRLDSSGNPARFTPPRLGGVHPLGGYVTFDGQLVFFGTDYDSPGGIRTDGLWISDGTPFNTAPVHGFGYARAVVAGNKLYLLYGYTGEDILVFPSALPSQPTTLPGTPTAHDTAFAFDGLLYFGRAENSDDADTLYYTDGTPGGTRPVRNTNGDLLYNPRSFVIHNGSLYFAAEVGESVGGFSLVKNAVAGVYRIDTGAPNTAVSERVPEAQQPVGLDRFGALTEVGGTLFFGGGVPGGLWKLSDDPPLPRPAAVSVSGQLIDDLNANSKKDASEPGLAGWTIQIDNGANGSADGRILTDTNGRYTHYSFGGLEPPNADTNLSRQRGIQRETTIAVNPRDPDDIFVVAEDISRAGLFAAYSHDGGRTWQSRVVAGGADSLPTALGDPSAAFDAFGNLFLAYLGNHSDVVVVHSADGGETFAAPAADAHFTARDQPTVVTGAAAVWVVYRDVRGGIAARGAGVDEFDEVGPFNGEREVPATAGRSTNFADAAVGPSGELLVAYQDNADGANGASIFTALLVGPRYGFNNPVALTAPPTTRVGGRYVIPAQPGRGIDAEVGLAWDRSNGPNRGRVYLIYTAVPDATAPADTRTILTFSDTRGATWTPLRLVDDTGPAQSSQFLPRIAVDQSDSDPGTVAVSWYDTRNDRGDHGPGDTDGRLATDTAVYAAVSSDGGQTFRPATRISHGDSNVARGNNRGGFGRYQGLAFESGALYPVWTDNSDSTNDNPDGALDDTDVYTSRVPLLVAGNFGITPLPPPNWAQTFPSGNVSLLTFSGQTVDDYDFGFYEQGTVTGTVYWDQNGNHFRDLAEPPRPGWTIFLNPRDTNGDGVFDAGDASAVTDANGRYFLRGLKPATYTIGEQLQTPWSQTDPVPVRTRTVVIKGDKSHEVVAAVDFGNLLVNTAITGKVYEDLNADGSLDVGAPGVVGRLVFLDGNANGRLDAGEPSTITDDNGVYLFVVPSVGAYRVREEVTGLWFQTTADPDDVAVTDPKGQIFDHLDFGNFHRATITGHVYSQENAGERPSDKGLAGWTVYLDDNRNGVLDGDELSSLTDKSGAYTLIASLGLNTVRGIPTPGIAAGAPGPLDVTITTSGQVVRQQDLFVAPLRHYNEEVVRQLYQDLLGREADAGGLAALVDLLDRGVVTRSAVAAMFATSTEYRAKEVRDAYQGVLRRPATAAEVNQGVAALAGGKTPERLQAELYGSADYFVQANGQNDTFLANLYLDILRRPIDSAAATDYGKKLAAGMTRSAVAVALFTSLESDQNEVKDLYQRIVRRAPDAAALAANSAALQRGTTDDQLAVVLYGSGEYADLFGGNANKAYVGRLYRDLLGRTADAAGLASLTAKLDAGSLTRAQLLASFLTSGEYRVRVVQALYQQLLRRAADAGGLAALTGLLAAGGTDEAVAVQLAGSGEYFQKKGNTVDGFLKGLFADFLGRPIDAGTRDAYKRALAGGAPRTALVAAVVTSMEYRQKLVQGFYGRYLGRAADSGGLAGYVALLQRGGRDEDVLVSLLAGKEYFTRG